MSYLITLAFSLILMVGGIKSQKTTTFFPTYQETRYSFGHIGIDYDVFHKYLFENRTGDTIHITNIEVSCDCSTVLPSDTIIPPGDTAYFKLKFNTKDAFGPTNRSFTVSTNNPKLPKITYQYFSIVGQWFNGIRPKPIALFFLPGHSDKHIEIPNPKLPKIAIKNISQYDSTFTVDILSSQASSGNALSLKVSPNPNLTKGTYLSNLTLHLTVEGDKKDMILTIPVKIVRY